MTRKPFDCVEMKRYAAEKIYEHIKNMTIEEELRFWNIAIAEENTEYAASIRINRAQTQWVGREDVKKERGL